jgi:hypothetical protein
MQSSLIPMYLGVIVSLVILAAQRKTILHHIIKKKRLGGKNQMDYILDKCVGKKCVVSTGSMGVRVVGIVKQVTDKWIEIEHDKKTEIISLDFIQSIRIKDRYQQ